jgi:threonylcarbamoyladenosine tRNA methylthiotransferase MtaB
MNRTGRVAVATFGCRVNRYDAATLRASLAARGHELAAVDELAAGDALVVNSCTVTAEADREALALARRGKRAGALVVLTGCLAERVAQEGATPGPAGSPAIDGVDVVVPGTEKARVVDELERLLPVSASPEGTQIERANGDGSQGHGQSQGDEDSRLFVKVQEGCDVRCAFCVVPDVRGAARSVEVDEVLATVRAGVARGFEEVILAGIHLGGYGRDLAGRPSLATLCRQVLDVGGDGHVAGVKRLRLGSLEPWGVRDDLVALYEREPRMMPALHLPLQSGSDRILRRMRRPITAEGYLRAVQKVLAARPETSLSLDVLVGFPGESDADFAATCALLERFDWARLHVFPYSPRPGTEAASLTEGVDEPTRRQRCARLLAWSEERFAEHLARRQGSADEIVVERGRDGGIVGHTRDGLPVRVVGPAPPLVSLRRRAVTVHLKQVDTATASGARLTASLTPDASP